MIGTTNLHIYAAMRGQPLADFRKDAQSAALSFGSAHSDDWQDVKDKLQHLER